MCVVLDLVYSKIHNQSVPMSFICHIRFRIELVVTTNKKRKKNYFQIHFDIHLEHFFLLSLLILIVSSPSNSLICILKYKIVLNKIPRLNETN